MELGACTNTLWKLAVEGMSCLAIQGKMLEALKKGLTLPARLVKFKLIKE